MASCTLSHLSDTQTKPFCANVACIPTFLSLLTSADPELVIKGIQQSKNPDMQALEIFL